MFRSDYLTPAVMGSVGVSLIAVAVAGIVELRSLAQLGRNAPRPADFPITQFLLEWMPNTGVVSPAEMAAVVQIVFAVIVLTGIVLCFVAVFQTIHLSRRTPLEPSDSQN